MHRLGSFRRKKVQTLRVGRRDDNPYNSKRKTAQEECQLSDFSDASECPSDEAGSRTKGFREQIAE